LIGDFQNPNRTRYKLAHTFFTEGNRVTCGVSGWRCDVTDTCFYVDRVSAIRDIVWPFILALTTFITFSIARHYVSQSLMLLCLWLVCDFG